MRGVRAAGVLALAVAALAAPGARADFFYQNRFVAVRVGRPTGVIVTVPGVAVRLQPAPAAAQAPAPPVRVEPPPGVPLEIAPPAPPVPLPGTGTTTTPTPAPTIERPPTLREFAATFRPVGGNYQATVLHPVTARPVTVSFSLPPGAPRVKVHRQQIAFKYRRHSVVVRFQNDGTVKVRY